MSDPYVILNVSDNADDAAIREAYVSALRQCSLEKNPTRFEEIRFAYECIETASQRIRYRLFQSTPPDSQSIAYLLLETQNKPRMDEQSIRQVILEGAKQAMQKRTYEF